MKLSDEDYEKMTKLFILIEILLLVIAIDYLVKRNNTVFNTKGFIEMISTVMCTPFYVFYVVLDTRLKKN